MKYWLLKTEPSVYSFDDLLKDKKTVWDGVANNAALICIRNARKGDRRGAGARSRLPKTVSGLPDSVQ